MIKKISILLCFAVLVSAGAIEQKTISGKPAPGVAKVLKDKDSEFSFLIETKAKTTFTIKPKKFKIRKGHTYFIDNTSAKPHLEIKAEKDNELDIVLPKIERAGVTVSEVKKGNLLFNGSFEKPEGWTSVSRNERKTVKSYGLKVKNIPSPLAAPKALPDRFEYSSKYHRTGKHSFMLEKHSEDTLMRCSSKPIPVEAGKKYYFTGFYFPEKFDTETTFSRNVRLLVDGRSVKNMTDRQWVSFPPKYTKPGNWRYTFDVLKVPEKYKGKKLEVVISLEMDGRKGRVFWDDLYFRPCPALAKQPGKEVDYAPLISEKAVDEKLKKMKNFSAKVVEYHQRPVLEIDGEKVPCLIYCVNSSGNSYKAVAIARHQGIKLVVVKADLNFWCSIKKSVWKAKDKYDLSLIKKNIRNVLAHHPESKIILRLELIYNDFVKDYPESSWVAGDGRKNIKLRGTAPIKKTSHISKSVRKELCKSYRLIGDYLRKSPEGKAVVGIHITFGDDGQWYPDRPWSFKTFDYSEGSRQGVIAELRKMYKNDIDALRKAWQEPKLKFEDIRMPSPKELSPKKYFLNPKSGKEKRLIDCVKAYHYAVIHTMDLISGEFKKAIGKPIVAFTYFPDNSVMTQGKLLRSRNMDGIVAVPSYLRRRSMGGHSTTYHSLGSFRIHNKIYMAEVDFRSEYGTIRDRFYRRFLGMSDGPEEHFNQMRRHFAYVFSQGEWAWFMTIGYHGHFVWHGVYGSILNEVQRAAEMSLKSAVENDWGQVVVFRDDLAQTFFSSFKRQDHALNHSALAMRGLVYSGLTWSNYLLSDLENKKRSSAKIYLFSTATTLGESQIKWVEKNLQKDGNVLIFANDAGRVGAGGFEKNIKRLTGMNIKSHPEVEVSYGYSSDRFDDPLSTGLRGHALWYRRQVGPLYLVDDAEAKTLATLSGTKFPGIAVKRHKNWTAIYVAGSCEQAFTPEFFRGIAKEAKVKPIGPAGDITYAGNGFLAIHAAKSGSKTLNLKSRGDLLDLATGKIVAKNVKSYTLNMKFGETRWFRVKY